ncbi:MAG: hypothetical protein KAU38_08625, partial [Desulfobacterales bacterium]|nr:hypothetical protein [Desulfobacterales bacterium]
NAGKDIDNNSYILILFIPGPDLAYSLNRLIRARRAPGPDRDDRDGTSMLKLSRQGGQGGPFHESPYKPRNRNRST